MRSSAGCSSSARSHFATSCHEIPSTRHHPGRRTHTTYAGDAVRACRSRHRSHRSAAGTQRAVSRECRVCRERRRRSCHQQNRDHTRSPPPPRSPPARRCRTSSAVLKFARASTLTTSRYLSRPGPISPAHISKSTSPVSSRRAIDRQRAIVMRVDAAAEPAAASECEPMVPGVRCHEAGELVRLSWQRLPSP